MKEKIIKLMKSKLFYYNEFLDETIMTFIKLYIDNWVIFMKIKFI